MTESDDEQFITYINITPVISGPLHYQASRKNHLYGNDEASLVISYNLHSTKPTGQGEIIRNFRKKLDEIEYISYLRGRFYVDIDSLKSRSQLNLQKWMNGKIEVIPEYISSSREIGGSTHHIHSLKFRIGREEVNNSSPKRIFLSHKSINKPTVREYSETLKLLGLEPWLDEDDMPAGRKLERSLLKGMDESCAAVFFITSDYKDEGFLETEIDYAIRQIRKPEKEFVIIALQIEDDSGKIGVIPDILKDYVWKTIGDKEFLKGLREILKALPFKTQVFIE